MAQVYRQGDVLIVQKPFMEVPDVPETTERVVLAEGERTGHAHAIYGGRVALFLNNDGGREYGTLKVGAGGAEVRHEEHTAIALPPGEYDVLHQQQHRAERTQRAFD